MSMTHSADISIRVFLYTYNPYLSRILRGYSEWKLSVESSGLIVGLWLKFKHKYDWFKSDPGAGSITLRRVPSITLYKHNSRLKGEVDFTCRHGFWGCLHDTCVTSSSRILSSLIYTKVWTEMFPSYLLWCQTPMYLFGGGRSVRAHTRAALLLCEWLMVSIMAKFS